MKAEREIIDQIEVLTVRRLRAWVRRGWVQPTVAQREYHFSELDAARVNLIRELKEDLQVNDSAMPVVLSLLDQVYGLREQMRNLMTAVDSQPAEIREDVARRVRELNKS